MAIRTEWRQRVQGTPRRLPTLLAELAAGRDVPSAAIDARLVTLANEHRLTGLLWTWARRHLAETELKTELAQNDLYVQAHLLRVWAVLEESVARLAAAGIEVATIKGVTTEARWYGRRGERPCSDVDLLLSPRQLDRAADAVQLLEPDHPWASSVAPLAATGRIQTVTTHVDGLEVDLHLDLLKLGIPTRQSSDLWDRTTHYPLPRGGSVRVLDDTTALVHLLVHLNKDRFQRLLAYADIARVMAGGGVDWERAQRFTDREGITVSTFRTLEVRARRALAAVAGRARSPEWISCARLEPDLAPWDPAARGRGPPALPSAAGLDRAPGARSRAGGAEVVVPGDVAARPGGRSPLRRDPGPVSVEAPAGPDRCGTNAACDDGGALRTSATTRTTPRDLQ